MNRQIRLVSLSALLLALLFNVIVTTTAQTRMRRPPQYDPQDPYEPLDLNNPLLPANADALPVDSVLVLEMDTQLDSKESRVGDQFQAHVVVPVSDVTGRIVIPIGTVVEGHVTSVRPAKWRRRSGIIAIQFDRVRSPDGRAIPLRAVLTGADAADRRRLDDEGNLKGGSLALRDVVFVGGGAVGGAVVGLIAGSALAGGGVGAAVGLTAALLMKGKDAKVEPRQRLGMRLIQPLPLNAFTNRRNYDTYSNDNYGESAPYRDRTDDLPYSESAPRPRTTPTPRPYTPPTRPYTPTPRPSVSTARPSVATRPSVTTPTRQVSTQSGNSIGTAVAIHDARVERSADGLLRIFITARTPSAGWRIFTNHEVSGSNLDVRVRGVPTSQNAAQIISHPSAPIITVQDRDNSLRRVVIHGSNGDLTIPVGTQAGAYVGRLSTASATQPVGGVTSSRPVTSRPANNGIPTSRPPTGGAPINRPTTSIPTVPGATPGGGGGTASDLATRATKSMEVVWRSYANSIGYEVNLSNGILTRFIGTRQPSQDQTQLLDRLGALRDSLRSLRTDITNSSVRVTSARRVQEDLAETEQMWQVVPLGQDLNRYWRIARDDTQALLNATLR
jgi:hypothetical protein